MRKRMEKLILQNRLSPGDILIMSGTLRDLHLTYPKEFVTDIRSPCNEIFHNNPYVTPISNGDGKVVDMQYPIIHHSGYMGYHFSDGYRLFLQEVIGKPIRKTSMRPDIFLDQNELNWVNPVRTECGCDGKYWIINAGIKNDYTLKGYPYYQEVVNLLRNKITFVQVGASAHDHPKLDGALDFRGKTNIRQLFRISYFAEGALCAVSFQMVIMQALKKPCVVVAGGREGMRWQAVNDHVFLHTNGLLKCCLEDGCWKSKVSDCVDLVDGIPKCMSLLSPERVVSSILSYYDGGRLSFV